MENGRRKYCIRKMEDWVYRVSYGKGFRNLTLENDHHVGRRGFCCDWVEAQPPKTIGAFSVQLAAYEVEDNSAKEPMP